MSSKYSPAAYTALHSFSCTRECGWAKCSVMCGQDADFENRLIHVDGKMGKRTAFMDDTVINVLQPIVPVRPADLVFTTAKGLQIRPNALPHTFTKAVNILGLLVAGQSECPAVHHRQAGGAYKPAVHPTIRQAQSRR